MSPKNLLALRLLIDNPNGLYGSEMVHASGGKLTRGTIYVLLARLVEEGWVKEITDRPTDQLQLARTRHVITANGRAAYNAFLMEQGLTMGPFPVSA
jgi:DNA-binding PadR family transcriptional regulator